MLCKLDVVEHNRDFVEGGYLDLASVDAFVQVH